MEQEPLPRLTLANLCNGGAEELFREHLDDLLANVARADTDAMQKRSILLKIDFVPNADRNVATTEVSAVSKLAPLTSAHGRVALGNVLGENIAAPLVETLPLFDHEPKPQLTTVPKTAVAQ